MAIGLDPNVFREIFMAGWEADEKFLASLTPEKREAELAKRKATYERQQRAWEKRKKYLDWCVANNVFPER
jgi:hypothetical protein